MANNLITADFSEPLDGATAAKVEIDNGVGHLTIDQLAGGEPSLASGTLQYFEKQGHPSRSLTTEGGLASLCVKASEGSTRQSWFRVPWAACIGAYEWRVRLNPRVPSDLTAHSEGGNVKLDLAGLAITRLSADTAGGSIDAVLPDKATDLVATVKTGGGNVTVQIGRDIAGSNTLTAQSGAGNVLVRVPNGVAARIHATSGLGRTSVDPRFNRTGKDSFQSSDYDSANSKVEITLRSGAGNVDVSTR